MNFTYHNNQLHAEKIPLTELAAQYGTPCYIYSRQAIENNWHAFNNAFHTANNHYPHQVCYAVKANSNLAILNLLARLGSGFDIVSGGELLRVIAAGGDPHKIIFSGVGKHTWEINKALEVDIQCFNVESSAELQRINELAAQQNKQAPIALRINPNIDAGTHPYISTGLASNKFGIATDEAISLYQTAASLKNIRVKGIACHLGSQITDLDPFLSALDHLLAMVHLLKQKNIVIEHIDIGGGLGVQYASEQSPTPQHYVHALSKKLGNNPIKLIIEPGRAIVANAGILLSKVEYLKTTPTKNFAIIDAAMNDLLRPALYDAYQNIVPVIKHSDIPPQNYDVVGPVCETADFLGKNRELKIKEGDLLAILSAGAYGFVMSSNYTSRTRATEVLVDGDKSFLIRKRERVEELFQDEVILK